jgi:hypothetical protein
MPLVTLIVGFLINQTLDSRQANENNFRLYTEMMGRREEADTSLRKDMFNSIISSFMEHDPKLPIAAKLNRQILNLELLAYNFHDSLDVGPLFKDVRRAITINRPDASREMVERLEKVAVEVTGRQLAALTDGGSVEPGGVQLQKAIEGASFVEFGSRALPDPTFRPGEGVSRVCLSVTDGAEHHFRQFKLEILDYDRVAREVQFRLNVSRALTEEECHRPHLPFVSPDREIEANFRVGLFDFSMIDNTRLSHNERCAVALNYLNDDVAQLSIAYFPASRASLKDKPAYDELLHSLRNAAPEREQ